MTRTVTDAEGENPVQAVTTYSFDTEGYPTKITDALGHERRFVYDSEKNARREEVWRNEGTLADPTLVLERAEDSTFDTAGNRLTRAVTLDTGETVTETWTYDHNRVESREVVSDADPAKVFRTEFTFFRDAAGEPVNIASVKRRRDDGTFETTLLAYDDNGQLETVTPPAVTPADGLKIVRRYFGPTDPHPGLLREISLEVNGAPAPHLRRTFTYDTKGLVETVTDARSNETRFTWDGLGRLLTVRNAKGEETRLTYTGPTAGLAEPETAPPGRWLTRLERGWTETDGAGQIQRLRTDARGDLVAIERRDDAGVWSVFATFASDSDGNRLISTDALGQTTRFVYDGKEQLVSVTDPADETITIDPRLCACEANHPVPVSLGPRPSVRVQGEGRSAD